VGEREGLGVVDGVGEKRSMRVVEKNQ